MTLSFLPIWIVDVGGAVLMIAFSFFCVRYAMRLKHRDPQNIIWTYLLWVSLALAVFAVSRSIGHIVKQLLVSTGQSMAWEPLRPYSGAINSFTFMVVGAVTLFFERTWTIYEGIVRDRQALQDAHQELLDLNRNLEKRVSERTAALTLTEHKYRGIFEASRDMILTTDSQGHVMDLNPAGYRMLGLQPDELTHHCLFSQFLNNPLQWPEILNEVRSRGFVSSIELDLNTAQGYRMRVLLSGTQAAGDHHSIHFLIKDIEQQRLMREQMAQADKLASIGELSAGIAHEINNPLSIIYGYTQLLLRQEEGDSQRREDLKTVEKHVGHCKAIVQDLLNFARTSKPKKELTKIDIIIEDVLSFIQQHSKLELIQIKRKFDPELGELLLDQKKIKQVLINLIMNAKYAVGHQGTITVGTSVSGCGRRALITVADTGSGIEKKNLARIFDPFFTTKPTGEGTGLGLSVSYGIIKNHGGDISVESRPGKGTVFTVALPISNKESSDLRNAKLPFDRR